MLRNKYTRCSRNNHEKQIVLVNENVHFAPVAMKAYMTFYKVNNPNQKSLNQRDRFQKCVTQYR